eukprot:CAMPEP_0184017488 /NCGR_PEP_ID=MMETSP0954-20121128/7562_1 /TAXON_ID=627963 /ORGANISM="Aplanochytrium sp, Strain PBS07" /LENGTH=322 /DNA_ID=CAMNT_0026298725 /DNA_START=272 /DNA_END=1240 /DNA_ORIENTATION=-
MSALRIILIASLIGATQGTPVINEFVCEVEPFGDARRDYFLATTEKRNGGVVSRWVPEGSFTLTTNSLTESVRLQGRLRKKFGVARIDMDYSFTNKQNFSSCFCASDAFGAIYGGNSTNPDYDAVAENCRFQKVNNAINNPDDLLYCPRCEDDQCQQASDNGASDPIWEGWSFFTEASGTLTGPGMQVFRNQLNRVYPAINENDLQCPPSVFNQPLPQLFCSDFLNAENGTGLGANAKNQYCGFSSWLNCENDLPALGGSSFTGHQMDINLKIVNCQLNTTNVNSCGIFCDNNNPSDICTTTLQTFRDTCVGSQEELNCAVV